MSNFECQICGTNIYDSPTGYTTGCEHYPNEDNMTTQIKIGQIWQRKDGRRVKITAERMSRGLQEFELTPLDKGRKCWKWFGGIRYDLTLVSEK